MNKRVKQWLTWIPRLLTMAFILFLSLFALDVFSEYDTVWETVLALFMHLIPNFILVIVLLIAWHRKLVGGFVFLAFGLITIFVFDATDHIHTFLAVTMPVLIIGALFFMDGLSDERR